MQDHELYRRILGIEAPWQVERVELQLKDGEVHVYLIHKDNLEWACAECGALGPLYDHQPERQWRHLDTCQFHTILHAAPPRSQCPEHGVRVVKLPWAEASSIMSMRQGRVTFLGGDVPGWIDQLLKGTKFEIVAVREFLQLRASRRTHDLGR